MVLIRLPHEEYECNLPKWRDRQQDYAFTWGKRGVPRRDHTAWPLCTVSGQLDLDFPDVPLARRYGLRPSLSMVTATGLNRPPMHAFSRSCAKGAITSLGMYLGYAAVWAASRTVT